VSRTEPSGTLSVRQWPLLVVVAGVALGLAVAWFSGNGWRIGCLLIGAALLVGAVERLVLGEREAGLLQVRGKAFDVAVLAVVGLAIVALAIAVPPGR
jgi:hypothetical protein